MKTKHNLIPICLLGAALLAISPVSAEVYLSHDLFLNVQSSSDGGGNFTYTLWGSADNPDFSFYFTPGSGTISIQACGVLGIQNPPGWQGSVQSGGLVTWQYAGPGGVWIHDVPLTFTVHSSISTATLYDGEALYPRGIAAGPYDEFGNPNNGGWGTESFSYLGPVVVPEPSATTILAVGAALLTIASSKRSGALAKGSRLRQGTCCPNDRAGFRACRLRSFPTSRTKADSLTRKPGTGKSPEPADRNVCPTSETEIDLSNTPQDYDAARKAEATVITF